MAYQVGYFTELSGLEFAEDGEQMTSTFMAMPYGEYQHPVYGKIKFDQKKAAQAAAHVNNKSRGTDLDIDYDHKQFSGEAAGWVKSAEARPNGLYLTVDWTKKAWKAIQSKAYRYFSPEFADEWKHPKTGEVHKNILFGGGITNRPFLKDILPLNMSELSLAEGQTQQEGKGMDPKLLRKLLGLPADATDEQVNAKLSALPDDAVIQAPPKGTEGDDKGGKEDDKNKGGEGAEGSQPIAATELPAEIVKLSESSPAIKQLTDLIVGMQTQLQTTTAALHLSETARKVQQLSEPKNGQTLSASSQKLLSDLMLNPSTENVEKFVRGLEMVKLGETAGLRGGDRHSEGDGTESVKKFNDAVQALMTQDKLDYGTAVERVASTQPQLFAEYREASYAFKEI